MKSARLSLLSAVVVALSTVGVAGPAWASPPGNQEITIVFDPGFGPGLFTASGPVSGTGLDFQTSDRPTGAVAHDMDDIVLDDGVIHVKSVGHETDTVNDADCTLQISGRGNYILTGGEGAYAGIKGHGHFTVNGTLQFPGTGGACDFDSPPTGSIVVDAPGVVKL